jgi:hypothetical protein
VSVLGAPGDLSFMRPEKQVEINQVVERVCAYRLPEILPTAGEEGLQLLRGLLCIDPRARLSAEQALAHPFFADLSDAHRAETAATAAAAARVRELPAELRGLDGASEESLRRLLREEEARWRAFKP